MKLNFLQTIEGNLKMKYLPGNDLVVIVGSWNQNILLDPVWVRKFLFDRTEATDSSDTKELTNLIEFDNIRVKLNPPRFGIGLVSYDADELDHVQDVAFKVADSLPHTPVSAFGVNFAYEGHSASSFFPDLAEIRALSGIAGSEVTDRKVGFRWAVPAYQLNMTITQLASNSYRWDFNFHHTISSLDDFKGILGETPLSQYEQLVKKLANCPTIVNA